MLDYMEYSVVRNLSPTKFINKLSSHNYSQRVYVMVVTVQSKIRIYWNSDGRNPRAHYTVQLFCIRLGSTISYFVLLCPPSPLPPQEKTILKNPESKLIKGMWVLHTTGVIIAGVDTPRLALSLLDYFLLLATNWASQKLAWRWLHALH